MTDITVLTSITGGKDHLRDDQLTGDARFIAYVSEPHRSKIWEERPAYEHFRSARRNSRAPKILAHQFCDTKCSIWLDGNIALRIEPGRLVEKWLGDCDFAVFRHPERSCLYEEARICAAQGLDDPNLINAQAKKYAVAGYRKDQGLAECNVIARRHTPKIVGFNNMWWAEYCAHSVRDQLSFMFAVKKMNLRVNWISPSASEGNEDFNVVKHLTPQAEPQAAT